MDQSYDLRLIRYDERGYIQSGGSRRANAPGTCSAGHDGGHREADVWGRSRGQRLATGRYDLARNYWSRAANV